MEKIDNAKDGYLKYPERDLVFYCLLSRKPEMAKLFMIRDSVSIEINL